MTEQEILENNKLIAEFMGEKVGWQDLPIGTGGYYVEVFYHSSWDWLMPVVKKISTIFGKWDYEDENRLKAEDIFYMDNMYSEFINNDIEAVLSRCVEFIKWYNNENNKNQ